MPKVKNLSPGNWGRSALTKALGRGLWAGPRSHGVKGMGRSAGKAGNSIERILRFARQSDEKKKKKKKNERIALCLKRPGKSSVGKRYRRESHCCSNLERSSANTSARRFIAEGHPVRSACRTARRGSIEQRRFARPIQRPRRPSSFTGPEKSAVGAAVRFGVGKGLGTRDLDIIRTLRFDRLVTMAFGQKSVSVDPPTSRPLALRQIGGGSGSLSNWSFLKWAHSCSCLPFLYGYVQIPAIRRQSAN